MLLTYLGSDLCFDAKYFILHSPTETEPSFSYAHKHEHVGVSSYLPRRDILHPSITGKSLKAYEVYDIHLVNCSQAVLALSKQETSLHPWDREKI